MISSPMSIFNFKKKKSEQKTGSVKPAGQLKDELKKTTVKTESESHLKKPASANGSAYKNLLYPLMTEKSNLLAGYNQYVFAVNLNATKTAVKKAIQEIYNVKPIKIRVIRHQGKKVRTGKNTSGYLKAWKKALVIVPKGTKIDVYEN